MKIKFKQPARPGIEPFKKEFESFQQAKEWILKDKREGYGDVLAYNGEFDGLSSDQIGQLEALTLEDALDALPA